MSATYVLFDTNQFFQLHYDFSHHILLSLEKVGEKGGLILVYSEMTDFEIRKHINDLSRKIFAAFKDNTITNNLSTSLPTAEVIEKDSTDKYESFLQRTNAIKIPTSERASRKVLDLFLAGSPPFGEHRKPEFKDAFIVAAVFEWLEKQDSDIDFVICTTDNEVAEACKGNGKIKHLKTIKDTLEHIAHREKALYAEGLKDFLEYASEHEETVIENLRDEIDGCEVRFSSHEWIDYSVILKHVDFDRDSARLLQIDQDEMSAEMRFECDILILASRARKVWDSVDREEVTIGRESAEIEEKVRGNFVMRFAKEDGIFVFQDFDLNLPARIGVDSDDLDWTYDCGDEE